MPKTKRSVVHHLGGTQMRFVGVSPDHQQVMIDGESHATTGMNPMELLLNAVASCSAFDVVEMIRKRRVDLLSYRIESIGYQVEETPSRYERIELHHVIDAPGLSQKMAEHIVELALTKYCSVAATLNAEISTVVELVHDLDDEA